MSGVDPVSFKPDGPAAPAQWSRSPPYKRFTQRAGRSSEMVLPEADLIVVDEAHHIRARSYRQIIEQYPDAILLGMTATPCRSDGRGLGNMFDCIVERPNIAELIQGGFLVPTMDMPRRNPISRA